MQKLAHKIHSHIFGHDKLLGIKLGRFGIKVFFFFTFGDNAIIFAKASLESCQSSKVILDKYCSMSGQLVNFHKSTSQCTKNLSLEACSEYKNILSMDNMPFIRKLFGLSDNIIV